MKQRKPEKYPKELGGALAWQRAFKAFAKARLIADVAAIRDEVRRLEQSCSSTFGESSDKSIC